MGATPAVPVHGKRNAQPTYRVRECSTYISNGQKMLPVRKPSMPDRKIQNGQLRQQHKRVRVHAMLKYQMRQKPIQSRRLFRNAKRLLVQYAQTVPK